MHAAPRAVDSLAVRFAETCAAVKAATGGPMHRLVKSCLLSFMAVIPPGFANDEALAARFPDAGAVVLSWDTVWTIDRAGSKNSVHVSKRIFVRDSRGFEAANQVLVYYGEASTITKFHAETLHADGTKVELGPDLVHDRPWVSRESTGTRIRQFTFPGVTAGSTLSFEFELARDNLTIRLPLGRWWNIQSELPVVETTMRVQSPLGIAVWTSTLLSFVTLEPYCRTTTTDDRDYRTFETKCANVPAFDEESHAPPEADLRLRVQVWAYPQGGRFESALGLYLSIWPNCLESELQSERITKVAAQWPPDAVPADKRVEAIIRWVRQTITLNWHDRRESVDKVLERGDGDEVERNLVALALLKAARIRAQGAILIDRTERRFDPKIPPFDDDEARFVIMVGSNERPTFLDVNCEFCIPGVAPWHLAGAGSGGFPRPTFPGDIIPQIRPVPAEANSERRVRRIAVEVDGGARVEGSLSWQLQRDVVRRQQWATLTPTARAAACLDTVGLDRSEAEATVSDPRDLTQNLSCNFSTRSDDRILRIGRQLLIRPPNDFLSALDLPLQETRRWPVRWSFPRSLQTETTYQLPAGARIPSWPEPTTVQRGKLTFQARWAPGKAPNEAVHKAVLIIGVDQLPAEQYGDAMEFRTALIHHLESGISVELAP